MPGHARKHQLQGNITYHVMSRGISRQTIFHSDKDCDQFLATLRRYTDKWQVKIYHWVIMSNHYHLLLEIATPEKLPSFMSSINRSYTSYHHKSHGTCGYLWQGRYKAQAIQKDRYFLACGRYIERNPVVANLTAQAHEYAYSSAKFYVAGSNDLLTTESPFFTSLGNTVNERQKAYQEFLLTYDQEEDLYFDNQEEPLGDKLFISKLLRSQGRLIPQRRGRSKYGAFRA